MSKPFILLLLLMLITNSCSSEQDAIETPPIIKNLPPSQVKIEIDSITFNSARISWSEAEDPEGDAITYDVLINNDTIVKNTNKLSYKFVNLKELTQYSGKIITKDAHKNKIESFFNFTTPKYYLKYFKIYNYPETTTGGSYKMIQLSDGHYLSGGAAYYIDHQYKVFLLKTDYYGNVIWNKILTNVDFDVDFSDLKMVETNKKEIVIAAGLKVTKVNLDGDVIWSKKLDLFDDGYGNSRLRSVAVDDNGDIYAVGNLATEKPYHYEDGILLKMNENGDIKWHKKFDSYIQTSFADIIIDGENIVILGIHEYTGLITQDESMLKSAFLLLKTDKNGNKNTEVSYRKYPSASYFSTGIIKRKNGNYAFHGIAQDYMDFAVLYEIDPSGKVIWDKSHRIGTITSIKETQNNQLIATGQNYNQSFHSRMFFALFDDNGEKLWFKDFYKMNTFL